MITRKQVHKEIQIRCNQPSSGSEVYDNKKRHAAWKLTPEQEEIRRLKAQIKQLNLERKILKEAAILFAKQTK